MTTDISAARHYLQRGDIKAIAEQLGISAMHVHNVVSGRNENPTIALAVLKKAQARKKEAEEIDRIKKSLAS